MLNSLMQTKQYGSSVALVVPEPMPISGLWIDAGALVVDTRTKSTVHLDEKSS
jgi:hypothetical protein